MHILLTDILTCPRCGPEFGLILQADRLEERQVEAGWLGCPNCRERYEVVGGVADLRLARTEVPPPASPEAADADQAFRCAALLGAGAAPAPVVVVEVRGDLAAEVAGHLADTHVVGVSRERPAAGRPPAGVLSRIVAPGGIPLRRGAARGVALVGSATPELLAEGARVLAPGGRLVVDPASAEVSKALVEMGLTVHLEQEGVVVASLPGPG